MLKTGPLEAALYLTQCPEHSWRMIKQQRSEHPKAELQTLLARQMSKRLAQALCEHWQFNSPMADLSNKRLEEIVRQFHHWQIKPSGTEGYRTAEVTLGGIDTNEISSKTLEANAVPGLYFIGECLDVTGHLGACWQV